MAAAAQATFAIVTRRGFHSVPSEHATAFVLGGIAVAFIAVSLLEGPAPSLGRPLSAVPAFAAVVYAGVVTAALSTLLFVTGIRIVGPLRAGIASLFEPVVGVVLAGLLLGEGVTASEALGGVLVLSAAALLQRVPELAARSPIDESLAVEPIAPLG
jgi:drug/metabolite transporter (DMT)-like permease